jgi:hypothetical protein
MERLTFSPPPLILLLDSTWNEGMGKKCPTAIAHLSDLILPAGGL